MDFQTIKSSLRNRVYNLIGKTSFTRLQLDQWLKTIDVKADRVLEVGAGSNPVNDKVKSWEVNQYKTLDNNLEKPCNPDFLLDLNSIKYSDKYGWIGKRTKQDNRAIKKVLKYQPNVIFCLEVMEYIYKPDTVLGFFHDILSKKGILYISFHTIYPVHEPRNFDSLRYTRFGIINLLKNSKFSRWQIIPRKIFESKLLLSNFYKKEKMHSIENEAIFDIGYFVKVYK